LSGISYSTVERILTGKTKSTSFEVLRDLTLALQGNLDDLSRAASSTDHPETYAAMPQMPDVTPRELATSAELNRLCDTFTGLLHEKDAEYEKDIENLERKHDAEMIALEAKYEKRIASLEASHLREIKSKDKWIVILVAMIVLLSVFAFSMLAYGVTHPEIG
jgi:hypothetical protein